MNLIMEAFAWLLSPERLTGPGNVPQAALEHLLLTLGSLAIASVIAIPIGWYVAHTGRGRETAMAVAGAARALPSFGLILALVLLFGVLHKPEAAITAFVVLAAPSILAGAITGIESVEHATVDGARASGFTEWQILWRVEVPLGLPLLVGGLRQAALQVVATVTLAAYVNVGGLGRYIFEGLPLRRYDEILGGAILVAVFALLVDGVFALVQRLTIPRGVRAARGTPGVEPKTSTVTVPTSRTAAASDDETTDPPDADDTVRDRMREGTT